MEHEYRRAIRRTAFRDANTLAGAHVDETRFHRARSERIHLGGTETVVLQINSIGRPDSRAINPSLKVTSAHRSSPPADSSSGYIGQMN
jgi:hypothetical protein